MTQFRTTFEVERRTPGGYVNGFYQDGFKEFVLIKASVQPMRGAEMEMLPEGRRKSQAVKLYTNTKLQTVGDENPDLLQAFGSAFEIITVEPWQSRVISHYKAIGVRVGPSTILPEQRIAADNSFRMSAEGDDRIYAS